MDEFEDHTTFFSPLLGPGRFGVLTRLGLATLIPLALLLLLVYIPDLDDPLDPSETVQLGSTFAAFWLLMSLALAGGGLGVPLAPHRCVGSCIGGRHRSAGPKPVELDQNRGQPGCITAGTVHLDGVGIYLPHRRLGGTRLASLRRFVSVPGPAQREGVIQNLSVLFWRRRSIWSDACRSPCAQPACTLG